MGIAYTQSDHIQTILRNVTDVLRKVKAGSSSDFLSAVLCLLPLVFKVLCWDLQEMAI